MIDTEQESCPYLPSDWEIPIDLSRITPKYIIDIFKQSIGYYSLFRTKTFNQYEYWDFKCRFGGRCRAKKNNTLKKYKCKSFIRLKVDHVISKVMLVEGNFEHTHPISEDFYRNWLGPSDSTCKQIIDLTKQNEDAAYIRRKISESVCARKFYDIRRSYLKSRDVDTIKTINSIINKLSPRFESRLHLDKTNNQILATTFVSRRFKNKIIARDILQMDDIMMTNYTSMPILNFLFIAENNNSQILGFSIMSCKEKEIFDLILNDIKKIVGTPRILIIDRLKAQKAAVLTIMPETITIFCKIHMIRSVEQTFGPQSIPYKLFYKFIENQISRDEYIECLRRAESNLCNHKRAIHSLIDDIDCYDPNVLSSLCLRGQRTTNAVEGFNGNIRDRLYGKRDIETVIDILDHLATEYAWRSEKMLTEIDNNIYSGNFLGSVAVEKLEKEVEISKNAKKQIMDGNASIELLKWINEKNCSCDTKKEYGLPCIHDIINRLDRQTPLINTSEIPEIYIKKINQLQVSEESFNEVIEHEIPESNCFDLSYSPLTRAFEEVASVVQRNDKVKELVIKLFNELKDIDIHLFPGRKRSRPANLIRRAGRKSQKRHYACSICGQTGHNKATCTNLRKESEHENELADNEMNEDTQSNIASTMNNNNTNIHINIGNGELLLDLSPKELEILESLSIEKLNLFQRYPVFHQFIFDIGRKKDPHDIEILNGVYYAQWKAVKEFVQNESVDISNEFGIIQLIYMMNYDQKLEDNDLLNHISELTLYLETLPSDSF